MEIWQYGTRPKGNDPHRDVRAPFPRCWRAGWIFVPPIRGRHGELGSAGDPARSSDTPRFSISPATSCSPRPHVLPSPALLNPAQPSPAGRMEGRCWRVCGYQTQDSLHKIIANYLHRGGHSVVQWHAAWASLSSGKPPHFAHLRPALVQPQSARSHHWSVALVPSRSESSLRTSLSARSGRGSEPLPRMPRPPPIHTLSISSHCRPS
ncbi:hypothetical protein BDV96DRAFT_89276 [Lophiotrema nucula]|uniref:Uncharacterized protein n=1 Tax=Lophiotrema nucula TaxID=690887 RepID=A0A6A5Z870_9PLEO|nr:hypothetical protein BDV96DRAFT_89276 [Lophiotrema nucula]